MRHQARGPEDLPRLLLVGRARIDLGAELAVGAQHVEADAGGQRRLAVLRGTMTNRTRKRRRPLDLWSQPKVQQRIQICHGSRRIVSLARAHLPFECGSRSMNRQTRAALSSSKRIGKSLALLPLELRQEAFALQPDRLAGRDLPAAYVARILLRDRGVRPCFDRHIGSRRRL
jgi:hypothetical protein